MKRTAMPRPLTFPLLAALLLAPLAALHAAGATYDVASDGNDTHDGKSLQTPFKRIQKAADVMQPGDTCLIRGGEYREKIVPPRGGSSETAGIKLHWAIDTVIKNNIIRRVVCGKEAGQNFGVWLDFACQGTRVTGNFIYDITGQSRERQAGAVTPGPFAKLAKGKNAFRFSAGSGASEFVSQPTASQSRE